MFSEENVDLHPTINVGFDIVNYPNLNRNIPSAGFIHTLKDTHTNYYTPNQTFRFLNMQENLVAPASRQRHVKGGDNEMRGALDKLADG